MQGLISEETKLIQTDALTAAGTDAVNQTGVDMAADGGWDGVRLFVSVGTPAADNIIHAEQSDDNGVADGWSDIADSEIAAVDTGDAVQRIDIFRPQKRYVRMSVARGTSTALGALFAELYRPRKAPYAPTDNYNQVKLVEPAEGTK